MRSKKISKTILARNILVTRQRLPLEVKVRITKLRIIKWYEHWNGAVYVAVSGKDSLVLLDIVRSIYPNVVAVYSDTGLEYPEVKEVIKQLDNVIIVRPKKSFREVINHYGYPVVSKKVSRAIRDLKNPTDRNINIRNLYMTGITSTGNLCPSRKLAKKWYPLIQAPFKCSEVCCDKLKKEPLKTFEKATGLKPFIGVMADEGGEREKQYLADGCNAFDHKSPQSRPMGFWTQQDVLQYIVNHNLKIPTVYGDIVEIDDILQTTGERRTGCMFCMFGVHMEKEPNRFQRMEKSHPKQYNYCINNLGIGKVLDFIDVPYTEHEERVKVGDQWAIQYKLDVG